MKPARIVDEVRAGKLVAYATDAGMPGVSDPGAVIVRACREAGLPVEVVPGPSASLTALALSGFDADRFVFEGFLPRKGQARSERLGAIGTETRTVVCFEAPGRVAATLADLAGSCGGERQVCVAAGADQALRGELVGEPRRRDRAGPDRGAARRARDRDRRPGRGRAAR